MKKKIVIAAGITAALMLTNTVFASDMYVTRGEAADMLLKAADDYNKDVKRSDIIKGYGGDGERHEDLNINRAEALVMLGRAFGKLPELTGHNARVAIKSDGFSDIPDWAREELAPILDSGIAAGTADGVFSPYDDVTKEQMELFIKRTYSLFGTNEKDDFYAAVNKDILNSLEIQPGRAIAGTLYDLGDKSGSEVGDIIDEVAEKGGEKGSKEQKIADFYNSIMDIEGRNRDGIRPIKKYLDLIDKAESVYDLINGQGVFLREICFAPYAAFSVTVDLKDSTKYIPVFGTLEPLMTKSFYTSAEETQKEAYLKYIKTLLEITGETDADKKANDFYEFEKTLSAKSYSPEEGGDVDRIYNTFTLDEICDMVQKMDVKAVLEDSGVKEEEKILVTNPESVKEFSRLCNDKNLDVLKTAAKVSMVNGYGGALSSDVTEAADTFNAEYLGIAGSYSDEERAALVLTNTMPDYIGELYAERYFTEEAKQDVLRMVDDIIAVYKERIDKLDWMSSQTKEKAVKKLDKMNIKVGYPDKFDTYLDSTDIKAPADGGSYFKNLVEIAKASRKELISCQGRPVDKTKWAMYPYTVNACYIATSNDITFPAAILQDPMYDKDASYEENLGAIGYIIAHEITHAFDNNGAKFDENGNAADWWTAEDYAEFNKRCEKMVYFYDGEEGIPGVPMNGRQTLSENVSDQGAIQCITEVASKLENPDYKKLYRSAARAWASTKTREYAKYASGIDVHSEDKLRINRTAVSCDEFYDAFGITEDDGMWVAPQDRTVIW